MTVGHLGVLELKPGRRNELLDVLRAEKTYSEGHGAVKRVRSVKIGGPESGHIQTLALFENAAARASYFDSITTDAAQNPMVQMLGLADPPATAVSRVFFNELGEQSGIADSAPLQLSLVFSVGAGLRAEAESALETAKGRFAELGVRSANFRMQLGGSAPGRVARVLSYDSWAAFEEGEVAAAASGAVAPVGAAIASGALTLLSQTASVEINV